MVSPLDGFPEPPRLCRLLKTLGFLHRMVPSNHPGFEGVPCTRSIYFVCSDLQIGKPQKPLVFSIGWNPDAENRRFWVYSMCTFGKAKIEGSRRVFTKQGKCLRYLNEPARGVSGDFKCNPSLSARMWTVSFQILVEL